MTNEEAIKQIKSLGVTNKTSTMYKAIDMAIKALEQQPCEDCVSRTELLKTFKNECTTECDNCPHFRKIEGEFGCGLIADFPSLTPKKESEEEE